MRHLCSACGHRRGVSGVILDLLTIEEDERFVVVAPHPDDESLGAGGVLLAHPDQADVFVVSNGGLADPAVPPAQMAATRRAEYGRAMALARPASFHWLGFPDAHLAEHPECADAIDFTRYAKAFLPWTDSLHPDHRALARFCLARMRAQGAACKAYLYEMQAPFRSPTHFFDITDIVARKRELIACYESTLALYPQDEVTLALNKYRSCQREEPDRWCECFLHVNANGGVIPPVTPGSKMDVDEWGGSDN
ncbi:MAG TPA: hypothetical protein DCP91_11440 [Eggerthellaceae bacterium]|nr:hypothetical protein [Eggerthellaceae bacterium]